MKPSANPGRREAPAHRSASEIVASREFKALVARRWTVSAVLLGLLFVVYYGFILLIPYAPEFMVQKIGRATTAAIPLGVAVIGISFLLTWVYVGWANQSYDPEVERLRRQLRR